MAKRFLAVVEKAFRGSVERQYNHILYTFRTLRAMRGDLGVFLRGNAIFFAIRGQEKQTLSLGGHLLQNFPDYETTLLNLINDGVAVYICQEELDRFGIASHHLVSGIHHIKKSEIPPLFESYSYVSFW